jgi:hypothetical protein
MRTPGPSLFVSALVVALELGCAHRATISDPSQIRSVDGVPLAPNITCLQWDCRSYNVGPWVRRRSRYGIGCLGNVPPRSTPNPHPPPLIYRARDVGKVGFPALTTSERTTLRRLERSHNADALRLVWLDGGPDQRGDFIVFEMSGSEPCNGGQRYAVLNAGGVYFPGENPYELEPVPGA